MPLHYALRGWFPQPRFLCWAFFCHLFFLASGVVVYFISWESALFTLLLLYARFPWPLSFFLTSPLRRPVIDPRQHVSLHLLALFLRHCSLPRWEIGAYEEKRDKRKERPLGRLVVFFPVPRRHPCTASHIQFALLFGYHPPGECVSSFRSTTTAQSEPSLRT